MKHFISNTNRACFFLFFAQTEKGKLRRCMRASSATRSLGVQQFSSTECAVFFADKLGND